MAAEIRPGSEFDWRSRLAHILLFSVALFLCVAPLFVMAAAQGTYLLKAWESFGIWWVIALSATSNLVLRAAIRRLGTSQAERMSVLLWAISSVLPYLPFLVALAALAAGRSALLGLSGPYLEKLGWFIFLPFAMFVTAALTTPERLRMVLNRSLLHWPLSLAALFFIIVISPFWISPRSSAEGLHNYFLWWEQYRRWWVIVALCTLIVYAQNAIPFGVRSWLAEHRVPVLITGFFAGFLFLCLIPYILVIIRAGEAGVLYSTLAGGTQTDRVYGEGSHLKWPWDIMAIYNVRLNQIQHRFDIISSNGLTVGVSTSIRYRPRLNVLGLLHKNVGPDYPTTIVLPQVQSLMRRVFGQFTPEEIYTTKRQLIEDTLEGAVQEVGERFVSIDDLLVLSIELPPTIQQAIQTKLVAEQASLEMQYRISRETQEKERKLIEAEGIQKFNEVVRASLQSTDGNDVTSLLKYRGIDATLELAKSPNTKVIVVGASDRMPLILDAGSAPSSGIASFGSPSYTPSPSPSAAPVQTPGRDLTPSPTPNQ
jgi:regulator of protease activity HflC (stomatin/prohibitin superfamily)